ncbi:conserved hypothetical protein [Neospora caninum Liverpool]|uniref:Parkinson disease 7 domain containing 1 family protein n=1 Tax=Neospora caninum (strain Liverpool) TaxID=572307 RepID=F0VR11_NEOCL|nr:conserved hypothetical protein [Neospora caninum Liverpool]CBZ56158.1 conserved hypothetical protein [Neospora caninum Liverpool]CEL70915.1 TPA: Parkinson disease 7 domain containing 1 family protein [Neospora caninum Liverpool]|eukprot:XP_003886184.1 conserved hypothetical protein [Neospora caninum Liverpool]
MKACKEATPDSGVTPGEPLSPFSSVLVVLSSEKRLYAQTPSPTAAGAETHSPCVSSGRAYRPSSLEFLAEAGISVTSLLSIHSVLTSSGLGYQIATPAGAQPAICNVDSVADLESDSRLPRELLAKLKSPVALRAVKLENVAGLLLPHHLGAAIDLFNSSALGSLLAALSTNQDKFVCSIGYGGFALAAKRPSGLREEVGSGPAGRKKTRAGSSFPFANYTLTGISPFDECRYPFFGHLPCMLQELLESQGAAFASFECTDTPGMLVDRNLVSGANEASTTLCVQTFALLLCCRKASLLAKTAESEAQRLRELGESADAGAPRSVLTEREKHESEDAKRWAAAGSAVQQLAGAASQAEQTKQAYRAPIGSDPPRAVASAADTPAARFGRDASPQTRLSNVESDAREQDRNEVGDSPLPGHFSDANSPAFTHANGLGTGRVRWTGEASNRREAADSRAGLERGACGECGEAWEFKGSQEAARAKREVAAERADPSESHEAVPGEHSPGETTSSRQGRPNDGGRLTHASSSGDSRAGNLDLEMKEDSKTGSRLSHAVTSGEDWGSFDLPSERRAGLDSSPGDSSGSAGLADSLRGSRLELLPNAATQSEAHSLGSSRDDAPRGASLNASQKWAQPAAGKAVPQGVVPGGSFLLDAQSFSPLRDSERRSPKARGEETEGASQVSDGAAKTESDSRLGHTPGFSGDALFSLSTRERSSSFANHATPANVFGPPRDMAEDERTRGVWEGGSAVESEDLFSSASSSAATRTGPGEKTLEELTAKSAAADPFENGGFEERVDLFQIHDARGPAASRAAWTGQSGERSWQESATGQMPAIDPVAEARRWSQW